MKILNLLEDRRKTFTAYREALSDTLKYSLVMQTQHPLHDPVDGVYSKVSNPPLAHANGRIAIVNEIQDLNAYIEKLNEVEKKLMSELAEQYHTKDYMALTTLEDFLGASKEYKPSPSMF